jgi:alpha-ribazole phosphatase
MEVYIIRHTSVAVGKDTCYGQSDVSLSETFIQDLAYYKKELPTDFDVVYCSPSKRCKELAAALECNNVEFEKWNDINQKELNSWMLDFVNVKTPNGENLNELFNRVKLFIDELKYKEYNKVMLISHAGVIRCIWSYLLEIPLKNIFKIPVGHNEIFVCKLSKNSMMDSIIRII